MFYRVIAGVLLLVVLAGCGNATPTATPAPGGASVGGNQPSGSSGSVGSAKPTATSSTAADAPTKAPAPTDAPTAAPTEAPAATLYKLDEPATVDGATYTFSDVQKTDNLGQFSKADPGEIYYTVLLTLENTDRAKPVNYNPLFFSLSDNRGYGYSATIDTGDQALKSGELVKGDKVKGRLAFKVDDQAEGLILHVSEIVLGRGNALAVGLDDKAAVAAIAPLDGPRAEGKNSAITLASVERSQGSGFMKPKAGKEYLLLDVALDNLNNVKGISVNPLYFKLKDKDSFEYTPSISIDIHSLSSQDIGPGQRARGVVMFEVPEGATDLTLSYKPIGSEALSVDVK